MGWDKFWGYEMKKTKFSRTKSMFVVVVLKTKSVLLDN